MIHGSFNSTAGEHRVLLVSADSHYQDQLASILEGSGFRVERAATFEQARRRMTLLRPSAVIADLDPKLSPRLLQECQEMIAAAQSSGWRAPLIVLADPERFEWAARLCGAGARDFLVKPFAAEELLRRLSVTLLAARLSPANPLLAPPPPDQVQYGPGGIDGGQPPSWRGAPGAAAEEGLPADLIIGRSPAMRHVIEQLRLVAAKNTTVLITGETGTGKERIARAIHGLSRRRNRPMVSVNCGGIPANLLEDEFFGHVKGAFTDAHQPRMGRFEQAHRSSIFLDEIGDLPLELQPKLLRVLQEREIHRIGGVETIRVDTRVIAATNVDLWSRVDESRFREDLFYRINVFPIHLPPLRERREDIPLFLARFLERFCRRDGLESKHLDPAAEAALMARHWAGNIRELENAVEQAVIRSQGRRRLVTADFPPPRRAPWAGPSSLAIGAQEAPDFKQIVARFERDLISRVLEHTKGNKSQAAELLGLKRTTLIEKLKRLEAEQEAAAGAWAGSEP